MTSASPRTLKPTVPMGGAMFEPRLTPGTLLRPRSSCTPRSHAGGELRDPRDVASFAAWGHAHIAPTDRDHGIPLDMPPFTP